MQTFEYYQDHATTVVLSSIMVAIGYLALGWTLSYLAAATRARRPELPKIMLYLPIVGGVLQGISTIVSVARDELVDLELPRRLADRRRGGGHRHDRPRRLRRRSSACRARSASRSRSC